MEAQVKVGDDVIIYQSSDSKHVYGTVKEIMPETKEFKYNLHYTSNDLKDVKAEHHGKCEVFKTNIILQENLSNIKEKVEILPLKEYIQREMPTVDNNINPFLYYRQLYEPETKTFIPKQLSTCLCGKVVNPDDDIISCLNKDCPQNMFYHYACLNANSICKGCQSSLQPEQFINQTNKRKRNFNQIRLNKQSSGTSQEEEDDELQVVKKQQTNIQSDKMRQLFENIRKRRQVQAHSHESEDQQVIQAESDNIKQDKPDIPTQILQKKSSLQQYPNINQAQQDKLNNLLDRYKFTYQSVKLQGPDKKRQELKEKFFAQIIYGVEELRNKQFDLTLSAKEQEIIEKNDNQLFEFCKTKAVELESNIFIAQNKCQKEQLNRDYKDRCTIVWNNIKDDRNFQLRRKYINGDFSAKVISTCKEEKLYNPEKFQQIQQEKQKFYNQDIIKKEAEQFIVKTSKGIDIISIENPVEAHAVTAQNKAQDVQVIQDENGEENNKQDNEDQNKITDPVNLQFVNTHKNLKNLLNNKTIDYKLVNSVLDLISKKAFSKFEQRLKKDLPESDAKLLIDHLYQ